MHSEDHLIHKLVFDRLKVQQFVQQSCPTLKRAVSNRLSSTNTFEGKTQTFLSIEASLAILRAAIYEVVSASSKMPNYALIDVHPVSARLSFPNIYPTIIVGTNLEH